MAEQVRDLMDPVWYRMSPEERARLDARGQIDPGGLFPVQLPVPVRPQLPRPTVAGQQFARDGWRAPDDWKKRAA
jgi:hypothetical protein